MNMKEHTSDISKLQDISIFDIEKRSIRNCPTEKRNFFLCSDELFKTRLKSPPTII